MPITHAERHRKKLRVTREAKEAYERGAKIRDLAKQHGVHYTTMGQWLREAGCEMRPRGVAADKKKTRRMANMRKQGKTYKVIGELHGVTEEAARLRLKREKGNVG